MNTEQAAELAQSFLDQMAQTANAKDFAAHMGLISRDVTVLGIPGFDRIGYDDWASQCEHEFAQSILDNVRFGGLKILAATDSRVMFKTTETVTGTDGSVNANAVEIMIVRESDGIWRVAQERVLNPEEAAFDRARLDNTKK
ncbi:MAG: hypothetical protein AMS22_01170 [Thiotrichales bacterium SG8_50]|nr:MAG: hypothetical protein AMS22_01170 [Thiotrichales bacterium SG8_50]